MKNELLLKSTTIYECYCPNCLHGQVNQILERSFSQQKSTHEMIGVEITCEKCGQINVIKDEIHIIPTETIVFKSGDYDRYKRDKSMKKWLEK